MTAIGDEEWALLCSVMNGYALSDALAAACEIDLFTALAKTPGASLDELARVLEVEPHPLRALLLAVTCAGLVTRSAEGRYSNGSVASKLLVEGDGSFKSFVRFVHLVQKPGNWHLPRAIRENRNVGLEATPGQGSTLYQRIQSRPELEALFHEAMGAFSRLAPSVVELAEIAAAQTLLDVGGGDGSLAIALCQKHPHLDVTLLDLPTVCAIATERIKAAGLEDRIRCHACDIFVERWPRGHDVVLMSHLLEIFAAERVKKLYARAHESLSAGGRCIAWTIVCNDEETGGLQASKSSLYFLTVASGEGMAYPVRDHEAWLRNAGFSGITSHRFPTFEHAAVIGVR